MAISGNDPIANNPRIYETLDPTRQEIRLIELEPPVLGSLDGKIRCKLTTFELGEAPPYTALSYRWGAPNPTFEILVNGQALQIRENLYDFLCEYQNIYHDEVSARYLWVDQISIAQANTQERNHQVKLMSAIYSTAERVILWLGSREHKLPGSDWTYYAIARKYKAVRHSVILADLLTNPYFERLWVVQEIVLARRIAVLVGNVWLDYNEMQTLAIPSHDLGINSLTAYNLLKMTQHEDGYIQEFGLEDFIHQFASMTCSDPRDKVYGMLGMVPGCDLEIDYSKSPLRVYVDAAQLIMQPLQHIVSKDASALGSVVVLMHLAEHMSLPFRYHESLLAMLSTLWADMKNTLEPTNTESTWRICIGLDAKKKWRSEERWWYEIRGKRLYFHVGAHQIKPRTSTGWLKYVAGLQILLKTWDTSSRWKQSRFHPNKVTRKRQK